MNKAVAWMIRRDENITKGVGHEMQLTFMDATRPEFWLKGKVAKGYTVYPLYIHPVKEQDIKYDVTIKWDDKTTHHEDVSGDTPLHHTNPAELTDEEIMDYVDAFSIDMGNVYEFQPDNVLQMIRAILRKAQEK